MATKVGVHTSTGRRAGGRVETSLAGKGVGGDARPVTIGTPHHSLSRGALTAPGMRGSAPRRNDLTQEVAISPASLDQNRGQVLVTGLPSTGKKPSHMDNAQRWGLRALGGFLLVPLVLVLVLELLPSKVVLLSSLAPCVKLVVVAKPPSNAATLSRPVSHSICTSFCRRASADWSRGRYLRGTVRKVHLVGASSPETYVRQSTRASITRQTIIPSATVKVTQRPVASRQACSITLGMGLVMYLRLAAENASQKAGKKITKTHPFT